jgi:hypothetical protein
VTLKNPNARIRVLRCDQPGCDEEFAGEFNQRLATVRMLARMRGWLCDNPGPGKPARDLCPQHRPWRKT